ncbi:hypothetical protein LINGRAPRIM_LOCUS26 [Linum grandiflorum]
MFVHLHKREDGYKKDANENAVMGDKIEALHAAGLDSTEPSEDDAYAVAINKAEHPGRVRGCGYGATPSLVFGKPNRSIRRRSMSSTSSDVTHLQLMMERQQEEHKKEMEEMMMLQILMEQKKEEQKKELDEMKLQQAQMQAQMQFLISSMGSGSPQISGASQTSATPNDTDGEHVSYAQFLSNASDA